MTPVGLAHDYLLVMRGAERTFAAMADEWPDAPIHTTIYDEAGTERRFAGRDVRVSPLQRLGVRQGGFRRLLPLFPWAVGRLDVSEHDVVVSSSSAWAHGVPHRDDAVHVCYCHSPFRYAWHERQTALNEAPAPLRPVLDRVLGRIKRWDAAAHERLTRHVANGRLTQQRISDFYGIEADVVYPPVDVDRFTHAEPEDFILVVGELVAHKRADVALEGAARADVPAKVVGSGPEAERWKARFPGAEFLGRVDDDALGKLYARCRAYVTCAVEEFGITTVEAQAAGRPAVAPRAGGASEIVQEGVTGVLLDRNDPDEVAQVLRDTDFTRFRWAACAENAQRFSVPRFRGEIRAQVDAATG
jgi:glycosyltransferase involved in cell wall biosynthesis